MSSITVLKDTFKSSSGNEVDGITFIVDGKFKDGLDIILSKSNKHNTYQDLLTDAVFKGIDVILHETNLK